MNYSFFLRLYIRLCRIFWNQRGVRMKKRSLFAIAISLLLSTLTGCNKVIRQSGYSFPVSWANDDGTIIYTLNDVPYGAQLNYKNYFDTPTSAINPSYEFLGWSPDPNKAIYNETTYIAIYDNIDNPTYYNISYRMGGGSNDSRNPLEFYYGQVIDLYEPYKPGYIFEGWVQDNFYLDGSLVDTNVLHDIVLEAIWSVDYDTVYYIDYDLDGGKNDPYNPSSFVEGQNHGCIYLNDPTKDNYTFVGWYDIYSGYYYSEIDTYMPRDYYLVAKWEYNSQTYLVHRYSNNTFVDVEEFFNYYSYGSVCYLYSVDDPLYRFDGWYVNGELFSNSQILSLYVTYNIEIQARYTPLLELEYDSYNGTATITGYIGSKSTLNIPSYYQGVTIDSIGDSAFCNNIYIRDVVVPSSVKNIGDRAFSNSWVTTIVFNSSKLNFGESVFSGCTNLISCNMDNVGNMDSLPYNTFFQCWNLSDITLPQSLKSIYGYAFAYIEAELYVDIPQSVTFVECQAFYSCENTTIYAYSSNLPFFEENWAVNVKNIYYY